jgi:transcriptional regulator GlxA family with amidase domain
MHNAVLTDWIKARSQDAELVLSVCTGALLLAKAGLLDGLGATTHHGAIDLLREVAPKTAVHADRRFVDNGRVICSAGIAAGIDMSLHVVARLLGREIAEKTARQMEYPLERSDEMIGAFTTSNLRSQVVPRRRPGASIAVSSASLKSRNLRA